MQKTYTTDQLFIKHDDLIDLRGDGRLNLGINNDVAMKLHASGLGPKKGTSDIAAAFFGWVAVGAFLVSIYFSFTDKWWWFIPGFIGMRVVWSAVKSATPSNYLDAAMYDADFYERCRQAGLWFYQMDEDVAENYSVRG
ncbi:hypothetical protein [Actibacterium pelagium]|uniref:Uncharacterized protein n=1 Tax=Actibacterium pelagium TaxID=2029103 RepID=A0A917AE28_9RHOB|nr:hypothetical protein [Actibacterium pelagium]GGE46777.1 hypothetical protein GCM10011517_13150 [Actibacterium pelagium]